MCGYITACAISIQWLTAMDSLSYYFNIHTRSCTLFFRSFWIDFLKSGERVYRALGTQSLYHRGWLTDDSLPGGRFPKKTNQETNESKASFCLSQSKAFSDRSQRTWPLSHEKAGKKHNLSELLAILYDPLWFDYKLFWGKQSII